MIDTKMARWAFFAWAICVSGSPAVAQDARDPTVAPPETSSAPASGSAFASPVGVEGMTVLMRDDKAYLVIGTRLYAPGDKVGAFSVDRITETQVWFRDATKLIKVPRFAGIERKSLPPEPQCEPASLDPNTPTTVAPCEDTPP
jgi:hypothetical protein